MKKHRIRSLLLLLVFQLALLLVTCGTVFGQCLSGVPDVDNDGICDAMDICLNFDDELDIDDDGTPYCIDDCVDVDGDSICDEADSDIQVDQLKVFFSIQRGYYERGFDLHLISNNTNTTIKYTTNNIKPTTVTGTDYSTPIPIDKTTIVKAIAIDNASGEITKVVAHSYLFLPEIINAGASYINEDSRYSAYLEEAYRALPVISISSNKVNADSNTETELEVTTEMFYPDNSEKGFMLSNGYETWGGSPSNPKKSIRLVFKDIYGDKKLEYDVFGKDNYDDTDYAIPPTKKFDKLLLRAGSQDGLNGEHGNEQLTQFLRNRVQMDIAIQMKQESPHGRYVHVYINGAYRGQYHLLERPDESFFESYFGGEKENYEIRKSGEYINGNGSIYGALNNRINLTSETAIKNTKRYVDLESAAKFYLLMNLAGGFDWSSSKNSWCGGHKEPDNGGYQFLLWDLDLALGNGGGWHPEKSGDPSYFKLPEEYGQLPRALIGNTEFQTMVGDLAECECYNEGLLTLDKIKDLYLHRANQINTSLIAESAKWGNVNFTNYGNINVSNWNVIDDWEKERDKMLNTYFPQRLTNLINHLKTTSYLSNLQGPVYNKFGGRINTGETIVLSNPNSSGTIYYTTDGTDPRLVGGETNPAAIEYTGPITLADGIYEIKARILRSSISKSSIDRWSGLCPRTFYIWQGYENIVINEIHYNPMDTIFYDASVGRNDTISGKNFEFIEIKNRGTNPINLKGCAFTKGIDFLFENDLLIQPDSFLVFAEDADWFEFKYGFAPDGQYSGQLDNDGEKIYFRTPLQEIMDSVRYDAANPWDEAPSNEQDLSLELRHPSLSLDNPLHWFRSDHQGGTPRAENSRICASNETSLVINEINYNSNNEVLDPGNWVELHNPTASEVDISNWEFYDNGDLYVLPAGTSIPTEGYLVLVENEVAFSAAFPNVHTSKIIGDLPFGLSKKGERLSLFDPNKCLVDYVVYDDKAPWPEAPDGEGSSLSLLDPALDNALAPSWESSQTMNESFVHGSPSVSNICVPGQPCNDGDDCTNNDTFDADCNCIGIQQLADEDNDGVCDLADQCPNFDDKLIGTPCDDGDDCTAGETYDENCNCSGGISGDEDNDGLCDALDTCDNRLTGTTCEDGDPCTEGETYDIDCNCVGGQFADLDNDGICNAEDACEGFDDSLLGQLCDDGDPATEYDTYNANTCSCSGIIISATICSRIEAELDDIEEYVSNGTVDENSSDLEMITERNGEQLVGLRFNNISIPQGSIIESAYIQFTADEVTSEPTTLTLQGEATDSASSFTNNENTITSRPITETSVTWEVPAWNTIGEAREAQKSPNIAQILQEVTNRQNYVSGNSVAIIISGTGKRVAYSYEGNPAGAAELCISYSTGDCVEGYPCEDNNPNTINDAFDADCNCIGQEHTLFAKVFLEGYYDSSNNQMHTQLQATDLLPLTQPFNTAPWNYAGTEAVSSIPAEVTDWILVMSKTAEGSVLNQAAGFINQAGELLSLDGTKGIILEGVQGNHFSIHHRSHLAILSAQAYEGTLQDFTSNGNLAQGNTAMKNVNGLFCLYAGDYDASGIINNIDFNNWKIQGAILNQYLPIDGDGNGIVNNKDYNLWINNRSKVGESEIRY